MSALPAAVARLLERPAAERRLGPFLLVEPLGHGGFAPVWLAREVYGATVLRTAAVKLFSLEVASGAPFRGDARSAARDRIVAEARALCSVEHPNVVRFYALPMDEAEGVMGLAMEHVAGTPLDARIAAGGAGAPGRLSVAESLRVGIAIASALSAVHRAGLAHRDVKPSNIVQGHSYNNPGRVPAVGYSVVVLARARLERLRHHPVVPVEPAPLLDRSSVTRKLLRRPPDRLRSTQENCSGVLPTGCAAHKRCSGGLPTGSVAQKICPRGRQQAPVAQFKCPRGCQQAPVAQFKCPRGCQQAPVAQFKCPRGCQQAPVAQFKCPRGCQQAPVAQKNCPRGPPTGPVAHKKCPGGLQRGAQRHISRRTPPSRPSSRVSRR